MGLYPYIIPGFFTLLVAVVELIAAKEAEDAYNAYIQELAANQVAKL